LLTGSSDVTAVDIPASGHALTLQKSAGLFSAQVSNWLMQKGFGGWAMPVSAPSTGGGSTASDDSSTMTLWGAALLAIGLGGGLILFRRGRTLDRG